MIIDQKQLKTLTNKFNSLELNEDIIKIIEQNHREFICPISISIITQPCIIDCGSKIPHVYEYETLKNWISHTPAANTVCPCCKQPFKTLKAYPEFFDSLEKIVNQIKTTIRNGLYSNVKIDDVEEFGSIKEAIYSGIDYKGVPYPISEYAPIGSALSVKHKNFEFSFLIMPKLKNINSESVTNALYLPYAHDRKNILINYEFSESDVSEFISRFERRSVASSLFIDSEEFFVINLIQDIISSNLRLPIPHEKIYILDNKKQNISSAFKKIQNKLQEPIPFTIEIISDVNSILNEDVVICTTIDRTLNINQHMSLLQGIDREELTKQIETAWNAIKNSTKDNKQKNSLALPPLPPGNRRYKEDIISAFFKASKENLDVDKYLIYKDNSENILFPDMPEGSAYYLDTEKFNELTSLGINALITGATADMFSQAPITVRTLENTMHNVINLCIKNKIKNIAIPFFCGNTLNRRLIQSFGIEVLYALDMQRDPNEYIAEIFINTIFKTLISEPNHGIANIYFVGNEQNYFTTAMNKLADAYKAVEANLPIINYYNGDIFQLNAKRTINDLAVAIPGNSNLFFDGNQGTVLGSLMNYLSDNNKKILQAQVQELWCGYLYQQNNENFFSRNNFNDKKQINLLLPTGCAFNFNIKSYKVIAMMGIVAGNQEQCRSDQLIEEKNLAYLHVGIIQAIRSLISQHQSINIMIPLPVADNLYATYPDAHKNRKVIANSIYKLLQKELTNLNAQQKIYLINYQTEVSNSYSGQAPQFHIEHLDYTQSAQHQSDNITIIQGEPLKIINNFSNVAVINLINPNGTFARGSIAAEINAGLDNDDMHKFTDDLIKALYSRKVSVIKHSKIKADLQADNKITESKKLTTVIPSIYDLTRSSTSVIEERFVTTKPKKAPLIYELLKDSATTSKSRTVQNLSNKTHTHATENKSERKNRQIYNINTLKSMYADFSDLFHIVKSDVPTLNSQEIDNLANNFICSKLVGAVCTRLTSPNDCVINITNDLYTLSLADDHELYDDKGLISFCIKQALMLIYRNMPLANKIVISLACANVSDNINRIDKSDYLKIFSAIIKSALAHKKEEDDIKFIFNEDDFANRKDSARSAFNEIKNEYHDYLYEVNHDNTMEQFTSDAIIVVNSLIVKNYISAEKNPQYLEISKSYIIKQTNDAIRDLNAFHRIQSAAQQSSISIIENAAGLDTNLLSSNVNDTDEESISDNTSEIDHDTSKNSKGIIEDVSDGVPDTTYTPPIHAIGDSNDSNEPLLYKMWAFIRDTIISIINYVLSWLPSLFTDNTNTYTDQQSEALNVSNINKPPIFSLCEASAGASFTNYEYLIGSGYATSAYGLCALMVHATPANSQTLDLIPIDNITNSVKACVKLARINYAEMHPNEIPTLVIPRIGGGIFAFRIIGLKNPAKADPSKGETLENLSAEFSIELAKHIIQVAVEENEFLGNPIKLHFVDNDGMFAAAFQKLTSKYNQDIISVATDDIFDAINNIGIDNSILLNPYHSNFDDEMTVFFNGGLTKSIFNKIGHKNTLEMVKEIRAANAKLIRDISSNSRASNYASQQRRLLPGYFASASQSGASAGLTARSSATTNNKKRPGAPSNNPQ